MVDNRAIAVFANHVDTASLVCMPASKHEILMQIIKQDADIIMKF